MRSVLLNGSTHLHTVHTEVHLTFLKRHPVIPVFIWWGFMDPVTSRDRSRLFTCHVKNSRGKWMCMNTHTNTYNICSSLRSVPHKSNIARKIFRPKSKIHNANSMLTGSVEDDDGPSTTLVQTEIFQQLSDIQGPRRMKPTDLRAPDFSSTVTPPWGSRLCFRLKHLNSCWMDCDEMWFRRSCSPQDELYWSSDVSSSAIIRSTC